MTPPLMIVTKPLGLVRAGLLAVLGAILVLYWIDGFWPLSVDAAHHYSLVSRLTVDWSMGYEWHYSLGEMNIYPRYAHHAAAALGWVLGSPLLGMHGLALAALFVVWVSLADVLLQLPRRAGWSAAIVLALAVTINRYWIGLDLPGHELFPNYFFAQLVGQALMLAAAAICLHCETRGIPAPLRHALLAAAVFACAGTHLLPSLELLGLLGLLMATDWLSSPRRAWRLLAVDAALFALATLAIVTHPSFAQMRGLASNDGTLDLTGFSGTGAVLAYAVLTVLMGLANLRLWWRSSVTERLSHWASLKYGGLLAMAIGLLCLFQGVLQLGHMGGSPYAVKKYVFGLHAAVLLNLCLFAGVAIYRLGLRKHGPGSRNLGISYAYVAPLVLAAVCMAAAMPVGEAPLRTSGLAALEKQLATRRDGLLQSVPGRYTYVALDDRPRLASYMMNLGVFRVPRYPDLGAHAGNGERILTNQPISDWHLVENLLVNEESTLDQHPSCRRGVPSQGIVVIDGQCLGQALGQLRSIIGFSSHDLGRACRRQGIVFAEGTGSWTSETEVLLHCEIPQVRGLQPKVAVLRSRAFTGKGDLRQQLRLTVKGMAPVELTTTAYDSHPEIVLPLPADIGRTFELKIEIPTARSPQQLGMSGDARKLGLYISQIEFK